MPTKTPLIGIDWGTSNCRGYLLSATGNVLEHVSDPRGITTELLGRQLGLCDDHPNE